MKLRRTALVPLVAAGIAMGGCTSGKNTATGAGADTQAPVATRMDRLETSDRGAIIRSEELISKRAVHEMPKAVAYRMSGDYSDNVPIALNPDGSVRSYPAPTDLGDASEPVKLAGGWWLDRRGVGLGSVFTRYTYADYRALPQAPTPRELLDAVIPGARVTAVERLPLTLNEALADTAAVNRMLKGKPQH